MLHAAGVVEEVAAHAIKFPDEGKFKHVPIDKARERESQETEPGEARLIHGDVYPLRRRTESAASNQMLMLAARCARLAKIHIVVVRGEQHVHKIARGIP